MAKARVVQRRHRAPAHLLVAGGLTGLGLLAVRHYLKNPRKVGAHERGAAPRPLLLPPAVVDLREPAAPRKDARPRRAQVLIAVGLALAVVSVPSVAQALAPTAAAPAAASAPPALPVATVVGTQPKPAPVPVPVRIRIPAIELASQLVRLDLDADGGLQDLTDVNRPGWYAGGPLPGSPGAALIVGHVDSYEGPAVFQRLEQLRPGDLITVQRTDGSVVRFVVDRLTSYPKDRFPTAKVFAASAPELRLITCFGSFDRTRKSYTRNLVVYASLSTPQAPPAHSRLRPAPRQKELL